MEQGRGPFDDFAPMVDPPKRLLTVEEGGA